MQAFLLFTDALSPSADFLAICVEYESTDVLRDDLSAGTLELDQLFQEGQCHKAVWGQICGSRSCICRTKYCVLEEVGQLLDVEAVVLAVELLEDCQQPIYVVRTVYREIHRLILPHDTTQSRVIAQELEHA